MGGSALAGNATAAAEFNIWHDPEAAAIVLDAAARADVPLTMYGLDVFYGPTLNLEQADVLDGDDPARHLAAELLRFSLSRYGGQAGATIGDAGAVCAVVDPGALTTTADAGAGRTGRHVDPRADRRRPPHLGQ